MASKQSSAKVVCPDQQPNCNFLAGQAWRASESVLGTCQFALTGVSDHACSKNQIFRDGIPHFILVFRIYIPTNSIPRRSECKASLPPACERIFNKFNGRGRPRILPTESNFWWAAQIEASAWLGHSGVPANDAHSAEKQLTTKLPCSLSDQLLDPLTIDCGHTSRFLAISSSSHPSIVSLLPPSSSTLIRKSQRRWNKYFHRRIRTNCRHACPQSCKYRLACRYIR